MNIIKSLTLGAALTVALTVSTLAQVSVGSGTSAGKYSLTSIPLPTGTLTTPFYVTNASSGVIVTSTVPYYTAGTTASNLVSGWTSSTITTNISIVWTNSGGTGFNGTFVTNTVYTTNTSTVYPNFAALVDRNTGLQLNWAGATNVAVTVAKSLDGINYDTSPGSLTTYTYTNITSGGVVGGYVWNVPMDGVGFGRIYSILVTGTLNMTNPTAYYSQKQNSP